ncbi:hypothetical protein ACFL5Z_09580, partial [Planctomycetota bacterium]
MKRKCNFLIAALCLMGATATSAQERTNPGPILTILIVDTSWSSGDDMPEFRTLGCQVWARQKFGDSLEILSAHPGRPRIRLAQTPHYGTIGQRSIISGTLYDIRDGFLTNAQVSKALKLALDRLDNTLSKQAYTKAVVIVLSDGHLSTPDAQRVLELAEQFKKRGWPLYITGDRNTNKNLLIAANKDQIHWSSISEANPALWLQQARDALKREKENTMAEQQVKQKKEDVFRTRRTRPRSTADAEKTEPNAPSLESKEPQRPSIDPPRDISKSSPDDIKARFRTELDVTVSGGRSHRSSADVNLPVPKAGKETTPAVPVEPNSQTEPVASD